MHSNLPEPVEIATVPDLSQPLTAPVQLDTVAGKFGYQRYRLTTGLSEGVELIVVETGNVRAAICPTRGMGLWKANIDGLDCGWNSPVQGPVHPNYVAVAESSGLGWLDGFDELLVRCGMRSFGAPDFDDNGQLLFPLHGRVANLPASNVKIVADKEHSILEVSGDVLETRFLQFNLKLTAKYVFAIGESEIAIHDVVTNQGATPTTAQMLYHVNIGEPLLESGANAYVSADRVVARNAHAATDLSTWQTYKAPTPGYEEQVYYSAGKADGNGWAKATLASKDGSRGFSVQYRTETLPYFSQWKNTVGKSDGYVTGLEPGTGFPNPRSFEESKGRVVDLAPGESVDFQLKLAGLSTSEKVAASVKDVEAICKSASTAEFDADWCVPR